ncbi:hypothetical protein PQX77_009676 [Marasmius sp. AFHP31]|nr:hypothetical protein PQX77_009676 [Marasmius sp. AFHP31]
MSSNSGSIPNSELNPTPTRKSIRLEIPHPNEPGCKIVGVLEQAGGAEKEKERKVALILHGVAGHKDYLFQKRLAHRLPIDSFRFDFRGNHETPGTWSQGGLENDLEDLRAVVSYLGEYREETRCRYVVDLVVGHSRGAIVGFGWMCELKSGGGRVPMGYVNASGRYRMERIWQSPTIKAASEAFEKQRQQQHSGQIEYTWTPTVARQKRTYTITPEEVHRFASWNTSRVWDDFPRETDVLTIHGLRDTVVSPYDAILYARALGERQGTHSLHFVEEGDHNFTGEKARDEVVDVILEWWREKESGALRTGVWGSGMKGKL